MEANLQKLIQNLCQMLKFNQSFINAINKGNAKQVQVSHQMKLFHHPLHLEIWMPFINMHALRTTFWCVVLYLNSHHLTNLAIHLHLLTMVVNHSTVVALIMEVNHSTVVTLTMVVNHSTVAALTMVVNLSLITTTVTPNPNTTTITTTVVNLSSTTTITTVANLSSTTTITTVGSLNLITTMVIMWVLHKGKIMHMKPTAMRTIHAWFLFCELIKVNLEFIKWDNKYA